MTKDEVWKEIKSDETKVYGKSMLEMFISSTDVIDSRHYEELPKNTRRLVRPLPRLRATADPDEARAAIKEGRKEISSRSASDIMDEIIGKGEVSDKWRVLVVIAEYLGDNIRTNQFGRLLDEAAALGVKEFAESLASLPHFRTMVRFGNEDDLWSCVQGALLLGQRDIALFITRRIAEAFDSQEDNKYERDNVLGYEVDHKKRVSRARMGLDAAERGLWDALEFVTSMRNTRGHHRQGVLIAAVEEINPEAVDLALSHGEGDAMDALRRVATIRHHKNSVMEKEFQKQILTITKMLIDALPRDARIDPAIAKSADFNKNHEVAEMVRDAMRAKEEHGQV